MPVCHSCRLLILASALLVAFTLAACQSHPEQPADVIISDAHGGGSALATSPDSRLLASGGWGGKVRLWQLPSGAHARSWRAHRESVTGLAFVGDEGHLLSSGYDGRIAIWDSTGRLLFEHDTGSPITAFVHASDTGLLATGHTDGSVRLWRADGTPQTSWPRVHKGRVRALALDRQRLASAGSDGRVWWWPLDGVPQKLAAPPSDARTLLFTPDGKHLLGAGWFHLFRWQLADAGLAVVATEHAGIINDLAYLADGRLASISRQTDSAVLILDAETGETGQRLQRHELCGVAVSPSPDGRYLSTTSDDASVRIWRLDQPPPR